MSNNVGIGAMLLRWKCSVYKVVYREFLVFIVLFGIVSVVYRNGLDEDQKRLEQCNFRSQYSITRLFFEELFTNHKLSSTTTQS